MKVLIIDNYDSFTFNLYQYVGEILESVKGKPATVKKHNFLKALPLTVNGFRVDVVRNDEITIGEIKRRNYDRIIISPGPGDPKDKKYFGVCSQVLLDIGKTTPILGVCLGMQGMAYYFGGQVIKAVKPMHGKTSLIYHNGKGVLTGLPQGIEVMRYHSLVADPKTLPECLEITAVVKGAKVGENFFSDPDYALHPSKKFPSSLRQASLIEIMGLKHKKYPIEGIQFHPESFATDGGKIILRNFLFNNPVIARTMGRGNTIGIEIASLRSQ